MDKDKDKWYDLRKASLEKLIAPSSTSGAMYLRVPTYHCIEEQMKEQFANLLICLIVKKGVFIGLSVGQITSLPESACDLNFFFKINVSKM